MEIKTYEELPKNVVENIKTANIFYSKEYNSYLKSEHSEVLYAYDDNMIICFTINYIRSIFKVAIFHSEPFDYIKKEYAKYNVDVFLNHVIFCMKKLYKVDWINLTFAGAVFTGYPSNSKRIKWGNCIINLCSKTEEDIFNNFTSKHRNMVRRGERANLEIKFGGMELLDDYLYLDVQTWSRSGKDFNNKDRYKKYIETLKDKALIGIAYKDGVPQSGLLGFYNHAMFYYMFGASSNKPEPGSTHYLQWETIKLMLKKNVQLYNFVGYRIDVDKGSKYENIQHFKKGFGGDLVECYMFKSVLCKWKYALFSLLYFLKNRSKPNDAIDQEIHKWKELN